MLDAECNCTASDTPSHSVRVIREGGREGGREREGRKRCVEPYQ